jgi:coenzyme F420 biosynthesis associated uncharacterized protein
MIDLDVARRVGRRVLGGPGDGAPLPGDLDALAQDAEARVVAYTGLRPARPLPPPEAVDRETWLDANVASMGRLLEPLESRLGRNAGAFSGPLRLAAGVLLGAEVGALGGYLGRRVLGQYDLALLDAEVTPRLLLVAPNLRDAARELDVDPASLLAWVTVHETTHAVQFSGVPWLREHLAGLLRRLLESAEVQVDTAALLRLPGRADLESLIAAVRDGTLLQQVAGPERTALLDQVQATMAVIEGHAEHVMDAVGADVLPDVEELRAALSKRRANRPPLLVWLDRLLGMELKLRQYQVGKAWVDGVVAEAGMEGFNRVFAHPEFIPELGELEDPSGWVRRTHVPPA